MEKVSNKWHIKHIYTQFNQRKTGGLQQKKKKPVFTIKWNGKKSKLLDTPKHVKKIRFQSLSHRLHKHTHPHIQTSNLK